MSRILVTGGGGFIASWVVPHLAARRHFVRVAVRARRAERLPKEVEQVVIDDLLLADWGRLLDGIDAILHLSGRAHHAEDGPEAAPLYQHDNVAVSKTLAVEASRREITRFIFASSVKVMGESTGPDAPLTEAAACRPIGPYGESKLSAEEAIRGAFPRGATILRLPLVYGPRSKGNFAALWRAVAAGIPLPFGGITNRRSLLYVGNLADAVERCLHTDRALGETFLIRDGTDVSTPELVRAIAHAARRQPRLLSVPPMLLRMAAKLVGQADGASRLLESLVVDDTRFRNAVSWSPPYSLESALAETARTPW